MLAAVGEFYHWPQRELLSLAADDVRFWLSAAYRLSERRKDA